MQFNLMRSKLVYNSKFQIPLFVVGLMLILNIIEMFNMDCGETVKLCDDFYIWIVYVGISKNRSVLKKIRQML
jgi:hypothetical protein